MKYVLTFLLMIGAAGCFAQNTWTTTTADATSWGNQRYGNGINSLNYSIRTSSGGGWAWRFTDYNNLASFQVDFPTGITTITNAQTTHNQYSMLRITGSSQYGANGLNLLFFGQNDVDSDPAWTYYGGAGSAAIMNFYNKPLILGTNNTGKMWIMADGRVGIGTYNPGTFKLAVEGKIGAREVNVTTTNPWPDYVFENDYKLQELKSVKSFVNENHHLPGIPSAKEIETNGVDLGVMNALLLKKIEELTLYAIEQNERISKLEAELKKN